MIMMIVDQFIVFPVKYMHVDQQIMLIQVLKTRASQSKRISRVHRVDSYDYKKLLSNDDDKTSGLSNLRRKSLSSCDLFHVTSKTLTSPFDEIQNWLNNKRKCLFY